MGDKLWIAHVHYSCRYGIAMPTAAVGRSFSDMKKIEDHLHNRLLSTSLIAVLKA